MYTDAARQAQITGTVVLRGIFTSTGRVTSLRAVSGLPNGLTEQAIEAAKHLRFLPAMKDGRPASMHIQLEYTFNLY
jgi:TonB family protein